ncbi:MAG: TonB-dependent receptor, partial [Odoribacter sp.]|nr:TonB-dependent receptor [Odoribacter sp.]
MKRKILLTCLVLAACMGARAENNAVTADSIRRYDLEEVTIHATKTGALLKDLPAKVEVVTRRQIEASGINNLTDLLKNFTNVDVIEYPGYNSYFSIRGFKPDDGGKYVRVLVDGVPAGTANMSTLSLGDVEQVEVLKGPFSSMYGSDAMGGVVNIVTKRNTEKLTGGIKLSAGSFQSSKGAFNVGGRIVGGLSFDASFDYLSQARSYKIGDHNLLHMSAVEKAILGEDTYGIRMGYSRHSGISARGRLGYDFGKNWSLNFIEMAFVGKDLPTGGNVWGGSGVKKKDITRHSSKLELNGRVKNHNLFFAPHYTVDETNTYTNETDTAFVYSGSKLSTYGFTAHDNLVIGKQKIAFGIDNSNQVMEMLSRNQKTGEPKAAYQPDRRGSSVGIFLQGDLKLIREKLNVSVGLRYDYIVSKLKKSPHMDNEEKTENHNTFNPNIGLKYNIYGGLAAHASFGTAFSMPDAYKKAGEFLYGGVLTLGNPDLDPEKSRTVD